MVSFLRERQTQEEGISWIKAENQTNYNLNAIFFSFSRSTISVRLKTENSTELQYKPGDHVAIFPANRPELVQALIDRLSDDVDPDKSIVVEASREVKGEL